MADTNGLTHDKLWADMTYEIETLELINKVACRQGISGSSVFPLIKIVKDRLRNLYSLSLKIPPY